MSKRIYTNPMIFLAENGTNIDGSKEGGGGQEWTLPTGWQEFLDELGVYGEDYSFVSGFDIKNSDTYPAGFVVDDPTTWDLAIVFDDLEPEEP